MLINYHFMTKSELHAWSTNLFLASQQFLCEDIFEFALYHPKIQHDRSSHLQEYWAQK